MSKLGINVGDEFPVEEIHRDENGVVHHHHYHHRRPRRPFRLLRVILVVMLIFLVVRAFHYASWMSWSLFPAWWPQPWFPLAGTLILIAAISAALYLLRCRDEDRH
ncbi:MAG TPA: hypothetical protein VJS47_03595 [Rhizomicrobium sp.]|nr:hypothetical protein [Rhizomicrobium sp.]